MRDDEFEWDDRKAARNRAQHDVSFETARLAFNDPFCVLRDDMREDYGEERYSLLGTANGCLLHVSSTLRGARTRIIQPEAEPYEHRLYHEGIR